MRAIRFFPVLLLCAGLLAWKPALAEEFPIVKGVEAKEEVRLNLPYAFYSESFGAAVGYAYAAFGFPQPQSAIIASVMAGTKGSAMGFLMGRDIRVLRVNRLFLDPIVSTGYFANNNAFIDGNPDFAGQRAGSNGSDKDNYVTGSGTDNFFRLKFKYLLPIGHGRDHVVNAYRLRDGLLVSGASGGESLNPLTSGKTFLEVRPFYRAQRVNGDDIDTTQKTNGLDFSLFWDNRDFLVNPSRGNAVQFKVSRDFGWADSSNSWTVVFGEVTQYFSLGQSERYRLRVIALDVWAAYSPTWDVQSDGTVAHRPPTYAGATLGGLWRLRGYPTQRFSDKAAIVYAAEYRMIPDWNPFNRWPRFQRLVGVRWIEIVPFVEVGRVSPAWNLPKLHTGMKVDGGVGLRAMAKGLVIRVDMAGSSEGGGVQMMVSQPFQF